MSVISSCLTLTQLTLTHGGGPRLRATEGVSVTGDQEVSGGDQQGGSRKCKVLPMEAASVQSACSQSAQGSDICDIIRQFAEQQ